ncbi:hypothetical protein ACWEV3_17805 [Saccharopolyspora sp. NPDC003752]
MLAASLPGVLSGGAEQGFVPVPDDVELVTSSGGGWDDAAGSGFVADDVELMDGVVEGNLAPPGADPVGMDVVHADPSGAVAALPTAAGSSASWVASASWAAWEEKFAGYLRWLERGKGRAEAPREVMEIAEGAGVRLPVDVEAEEVPLLRRKQFGRHLALIGHVLEQEGEGQAREFAQWLVAHFPEFYAAGLSEQVGTYESSANAEALVDIAGGEAEQGDYQPVGPVSMLGDVAALPTTDGLSASWVESASWSDLESASVGELRRAGENPGFREVLGRRLNELYRSRNPQDQVTLARVLKALNKGGAYTQADLSQMVGCSPTSIHRIIGKAEAEATSSNGETGGAPPPQELGSSSGAPQTGDSGVLAASLDAEPVSPGSAASEPTGDVATPQTEIHPLELRVGEADWSEFRDSPEGRRDVLGNRTSRAVLARRLLQESETNTRRALAGMSGFPIATIHRLIGEVKPVDPAGAAGIVHDLVFRVGEADWSEFRDSPEGRRDVLGNRTSRAILARRLQQENQMLVQGDLARMSGFGSAQISILIAEAGSAGAVGIVHDLVFRVGEADWSEFRDSPEGRRDVLGNRTSRAILARRLQRERQTLSQSVLSGMSGFPQTTINDLVNEVRPVDPARGSGVVHDLVFRVGEADWSEFRDSPEGRRDVLANRTSRAILARRLLQERQSHSQGKLARMSGFSQSTISNLTREFAEDR